MYSIRIELLLDFHQLFVLITINFILKKYKKEAVVVQRTRLCTSEHRVVS